MYSSLLIKLQVGYLSILQVIRYYYQEGHRQDREQDAHASHHLKGEQEHGVQAKSRSIHLFQTPAYVTFVSVRPGSQDRTPNNKS